MDAVPAKDRRAGRPTTSSSRIVGASRTRASTPTSWPSTPTRTTTSSCRSPTPTANGRRRRRVQGARTSRAVLLNGPAEALADSGDWWEAQTILLRRSSRSPSARRPPPRPGGDAADAEAVRFPISAAKTLSFHEADQPAHRRASSATSETLAEWKAIQARLVTARDPARRVRRRCGGEVRRPAEDAPTADAPPPAPAPPAPRPAAAPAPAGMDARSPPEIPGARPRFEPLAAASLAGLAALALAATAAGAGPRRRDPLTRPETCARSSRRSPTSPRRPG